MNSQQIDFVVNSSKPLPEWLKTHQVFKELKSLEKIFPKIGLRNFKQDVDIIASQEARNAATSLGSRIYEQLARVSTGLHNLHSLKLTELPSGKARNELLNKIQYAKNLIAVLYPLVGRHDYIKTVENRLVLALSQDIFSGCDVNPVFKQGEILFRVLNKFNTILNEIGYTPTINYEGMQEFKDFSRLNVPGSKYEVVFSSDGEQGAWDIATMSMRGQTWASCQAWDRPQSRGLIGSVSSKYVGVIYVASKTEKVDVGVKDAAGNFVAHAKVSESKILFRCVVRFAIHSTTREPALILDHMYSGYNVEVASAFKKLLGERSGLKVLVSDEGKENITTNYFLLDEVSRTFLKQGEFAYMDSPLNVRADAAVLKRKIIPNKIAETVKIRLSRKIEQLMQDRRDKYTKAFAELEKNPDFATFEKEVEEWNEAKSKWEKIDKLKLPVKMQIFEKPRPKLKVPNDLDAFNDQKKGILASKSILNFLKSCDTNHGVNSATELFLNPLLDRLIAEIPTNITTEGQCYRHMVFELTRAGCNNSSIKDQVWEQLKQNGQRTYMKSFPKASNRFYETIITDLRSVLVQACKESMKGESSNIPSVVARTDAEIWLRRKPNFADY